MATATKLQRRIDIVGYMDRWARWKDRGFRFVSGYECMTGKILDGMPSTTCTLCKGKGYVTEKDVKNIQGKLECPSCKGSGKVRGGLDVIETSKTINCNLCLDKKGKPTGEINGNTCFKCGGRKRRRIIDVRVNPASIHSTRFRGANEDEDVISALVDRTVAGWEMDDSTFWMHMVTLMEYGMSGTQKQKARHCGAYGISQAWYSKNLAKAHERLEAVIEEALASGII